MSGSRHELVLRPTLMRSEVQTAPFVNGQGHLFRIRFTRDACESEV